VPHRILSSLHRRSRLSQAIIRRAALGPVAGDHDLVLPYRFGLPIHGWAHLRSGQVRPGRRISFSTTRILPTPVLTVDEVCREQEVERVAFLKIDVEGFEQLARRTRALGFDGKWVLHPSQIEAANRIYGVSLLEHERAMDLLDAYAAGEQHGRGAAMFGDEMIDEASRKMAEVTASRGRAAGMKPRPDDEREPAGEG
jgi:hypothetical protein